MKKMKCAVIGCGAIGTTHAERYAKSAHGELAAVVDILPERAQALATGDQTIQKLVPLIPAFVGTGREPAALALLSGLTPDDLGAAVEGEQWRRLAAVPGIGRRTAERLIVELKGKVAGAERPAGGTPRDDAVSALLNLGYPVRAAEEAVGDLLRSDPQIELSELLRRALQALVH